MNRNAYIDGMMGLVVGDALGVPYEFRSREQMKAESATDMIGYGTYNVPVKWPCPMLALWKIQQYRV